MRRLPSSLLLCVLSLVVLAAPCATCRAADPAAETREKLVRKGIMDRKGWSVDVSLVQTGRGRVLDFLREVARAKPREVNMVIDNVGIRAAGINLDDPIDLYMKGASIKEVLNHVLGKEMAWDILPDGIVVVTARERLPMLVSRLRAPAVVWPTPAAIRTAAKLKTRGMVGGQEWSVSLNLTATGLGSTLDFVAEAARAKPREITIRVDREGIEGALVNLDEPVDLHARDFSIQQALALVLPDELAFGVMGDGSVLVTERERFERPAADGEPLRIAQTPQAAATCALILPDAETAKPRRPVDLALDGATLEAALAAIRDKAAQLEPPVGVSIDRPGILAAGVAVEWPVTVTLSGVSLGQAVAAVLPPRLAYSVAADGTVIVSSREKILGLLPRAAAETRDRLWKNGVIDGQDWSLSVQMTATSLRTALSYVTELAKAPPRNIRVEVDPQAFANDFGDLHVYLQLKEVSTGQALKMLLDKEANFAVRSDGSVLVASPKAIRRLIQQGAAFPAREPD